MGSPASHRISRVRRYSRSCSTAPFRSSATGLSPPAVAPSSGVRLISSLPRGPCRTLPASRSTPGGHRRQSVPPPWFGLLPVRSPLLRESSLFLGVREMFQFPQFPPGQSPGSPVSPGGVAPFGDRRITGCQPLPCAFRRVATSFIGLLRLGIHHVLIIGDRPRPASRRLWSSWCAR